MRLIFLGPPGAGKTTQAEILAHEWQIPHISPDQILRHAIARKSSLGLKVQNYVAAGEQVPDNLMLLLLQERLKQSDARRGWILHEFPRNVAQAEAFDVLLQSIGQRYNHVFLLHVNFDVLAKRILKRGQPDDTLESISKRIEVYQEQTTPLVQYYRKSKCLTLINGDRPIEAITEYVQTSIQSLTLV